MHAVSRLEILSYAFIAMLAVSGALLAHGHVIGDGVDMFGTFWFYAWILDCMQHLRDPSHTLWMYFPLGKDLFAHTGNNFLDAAISAPFQLAFGFPRYQPVFVGFVLFGNALCFRPLARHLLGPGWPAWGATALWMLNPYILFECMTGRFTQAFLWFLPLAVLHFLRATDAAERGQPFAGSAVKAGLFTALQAYTYWFMGYFMALAFAWLAALALWRSGSRRRLLMAWGVAALSCLVLVAPAVIAMAARAAAGEVPGLVGGQGSGMSGPSAVANNVSQDLHGYTLMERSGQPMLAYLVWGGGGLAYLLFGRDRLRWAGLALVSLLFAVGPVWPDLFGHRIPMPHYLFLYHNLPFFDRLWFPYRLLSVVFLGLSLGLGSLLVKVEAWAARAQRPPGVIPMLLVLATMVEQSKNLAFPLLHRDFTPPEAYAWIGQVQGGLIELPIGLSRVSVAWQAVHRQPTWGGMGENAKVLWPPGFERRQKNSFIRFLKAVTRDPDNAKTMKFEESDRIALQREGFRWVVLDRQLVDSEAKRAQEMLGKERVNAEDLVFRTTASMTARLGDPTAADGALLVWDLEKQATPPAGLRVDPEDLNIRSWPTEDMPEYERHLRELGRVEGP